jgi:O-succinylbenzoate synthase
MRIERVHLREIRMPLVTPFETSFGRASLRRMLLVEAAVDGVAGWGEVTAGETPYYGPETVDTAWLILRDFLWPAVQGREFASAADFFGLLSQVRGHAMAKGGLEAAVWDAEARARGVPLWRLLLREGEPVREEIPAGVSIGIKPTLEELVATVEKEAAAGYQRIKIKIRPGWDVEPVARIRDRLPRIKLMVDANSAYRLGDLPRLRELDRFYLMMIEQPLGWDDLYGHIAVQRELSTPVCLDECIHTEEHARAAVELGACRIINIKLGRVGGHAQARRVHDACRERGVPVWCGGMLESGIGRAHNIALSALPGFTLPGDVSASRRYWEEDVIEPEVEVTRQGTIRVPQGPGIGFAPKLDRIRKLTAREEVLS